jgi:hypothetical protein
MARVASELSFVDRQVIDRTGLTGVFDVDLEWTPDSPGAAASPDTGPSVFTAIHEQLGLKLEPATAPLDVIVMDSAERPSNNRPVKLLFTLLSSVFSVRVQVQVQVRFMVSHAQACA